MAELDSDGRKRKKRRKLKRRKRNEKIGDGEDRFVR